MIKKPIYQLLRWSERYTKIDMVHFASGNFWLNFSRIISIGTGMLITVAFANLISPEVFGTYKYVIASAGFIAAFSLTGLGSAVMRAVGQGKLHIIPAVVRTANFWSIPASLAALGVSIYYFAHANSDLGFAFLFIATTNTFSTGLGVTKSVWMASGNFKLGTIVGIPRIIVPFLIILFTILFTQNVVWILLAYFASSLITSWISYRFMLWWFRVRGSKQDVADTVRFGKQMTALGFFQLISGQIDQLLLWHFTTPATLAVYALALAPVNEAQNLLNNVQAILFPKIAAKSEGEVHKILPTRMKQMFLLSCVLVLLYVILVPFLFSYLFPKYMAAVIVSQALAFTILFQLKGVIDVFFTAHGQIAKRAQVILISQAFKFVLFLVLIPLYGLWGAVAATMLSELIGACVFLYIYIQTARAHSKAAEPIE